MEELLIAGRHHGSACCIYSASKDLPGYESANCTNRKWRSTPCPMCKTGEPDKVSCIAAFRRSLHSQMSARYFGIPYRFAWPRNCLVASVTLEAPLQRRHSAVEIEQSSRDNQGWRLRSRVSDLGPHNSDRGTCSPGQVNANMQCTSLHGT